MALKLGMHWPHLGLRADRLLGPTSDLFQYAWANAQECALLTSFLFIVMLAAGWRTILVCINHTGGNYTLQHSYIRDIKYTERGMVLSSSPTHSPASQTLYYF